MGPWKQPVDRRQGADGQVINAKPWYLELPRLRSRQIRRTGVRGYLSIGGFSKGVKFGKFIIARIRDTSTWAMGWTTRVTTVVGAASFFLELTEAVLLILKEA